MKSQSPMSKSVSIENKLPIQVLGHNTSEFGVSTCVQAYDWFKKPVPLYVAFFSRNPAGEQRVTLIPFLNYGKRTSGLHVSVTRLAKIQLSSLVRMLLLVVSNCIYAYVTK